MLSRPPSSAGNYSNVITTLVQKSNFWGKVAILVKTRNVGQKYVFWPKSEF